MKCVNGIILKTFFRSRNIFPFWKTNKVKGHYSKWWAYCFCCWGHGSRLGKIPMLYHMTLALFSFQQIYNEYSAPLIKIQNWILRLWMFYTITIAQLNERFFFTIRKEWSRFAWFSDRLHVILPWTHNTLNLLRENIIFKCFVKLRFADLFPIWLVSF